MYISKKCSLITTHLLLISFKIYAWMGMDTPLFHGDGRYLKDPLENIVILHGLLLTPNP